MSRTSWKCLLIGAVVAIAVSVVVPQANACGGRCYGSYGYGGWGGYAGWGCCGSYGWGGCGAGCYSGYSPSYGVGGCCGSYLASDWYLGSCRCGHRFGCGSRGWGCGYSGGCSDCGSTSAGSSCCGGVPVTGNAPVQGTQTPGPSPTPARKPVIEPEAPNATPPNEPVPGGALPGPTPITPLPGPTPITPPTKTTSSMSFENSGVLTVWVPYDAKVTINGRLTKSVGSRRQFVSYGLQQGLSYKYVVKAEVVRDGQTVEDTRTINLTAGQIDSVAFGFNLTPPEQVAVSK